MNLDIRWSVEDEDGLWHHGVHKAKIRSNSGRQQALRMLTDKLLQRFPKWKSIETSYDEPE